MTRTGSCHLIDMLTQIPDPRNSRGKRHPLSAILTLTVIALMCGYKTYTAMADWGRIQSPQFAKALGFTDKKTPCAATFHNLFKRLDVQALEQILTEWVTTVLQQGPASEGGMTAVAIDGKTLRGSKKQDAKITHLLSVVTHELGITLTQRHVCEKTNEVPISTEILTAFDVGGNLPPFLSTKASQHCMAFSKGNDLGFRFCGQRSGEFADSKRIG